MIKNSVTISVPADVRVGADNVVDVPINISSLRDVLGFNVTLQYDPKVLETAGGFNPVDVSLGPVLKQYADWNLTSFAFPGMVCMCFACTNPLPGGDGTIAVVRFRAVDGLTASIIALSGLAMDRAFQGGEISFAYRAGNVVK